MAYVTHLRDPERRLRPYVSREKIEGVFTQPSFTGGCKKKNDLGSPADFGDRNSFGYGDGAGSGGSIALPDRQQGSNFANSSKGQFAPVYFAFDSFSVASAESGKIDAVASFARRNNASLSVPRAGEGEPGHGAANFYMGVVVQRV